ncbi:unnamed protein product [Cuscuta epithymum]|uniref:Uncharacterized protein n=1 Tax=Cuscuta epithymum TaxID=186058 RepID=A0AAV0EG14_9ASTE|nr:unnamed protein product [Cuscuta epithymum]
MEPFTALSSPRISFSADYLDENDFISICPNSDAQKDKEKACNAPEFEFLSGELKSESCLITPADELFFEGKMIPFWEMTHFEKKLGNISLKTEEEEEMEKQRKEAAWFLDDDPSPRLPKCIVLWKELMRLRRNRPSSSLSPSSSTSSSSSGSLPPPADERPGKSREKGGGKVMKVKKGGVETAKSAATIRDYSGLEKCSVYYT